MRTRFLFYLGVLCIGIVSLKLLWDNLTMLMILVLIITSLISLNRRRFNTTQFWISLFVIVRVLCVFFRSLRLVSFYLSFEFSLVPILYLIIRFGYQPERISASRYLLIYTIGFSLVFLLLLVRYSNLRITTRFIGYSQIYLVIPVRIMRIFLLPFFVKCPIFFLHLWLPKAHVEAPAVGSILLAGILLKLGTYGVWRIRIILKISLLWRIIGFLLASSVIRLIICMRQSDQKAIIAYSSILHITFLIRVLLMIRSVGLKGGLILMFTHGVISRLLFFLSNNLFYRSCSRSLSLLAGVINYTFGVSVVYVLVLILNFSIPITLRFISELYLFYSAILLGHFSITVILGLLILSCYYCVLLFVISWHMKISLRFRWQVFLKDFQVILGFTVLICLMILNLTKL